MNLRKLEELNKRKNEIENFLNQLKLSHDIEMNKMKDENIRNQMLINQQIKITKKEIENKNKEHQLKLKEIDIKYKDNLESIDNKHKQKWNKL